VKKTANLGFWRYIFQSLRKASNKGLCPVSGGMTKKVLKTVLKVKK